MLSLAWEFTAHSLSLTEHVRVLLKASLVTASWVCVYFAVKHLPISIAGPLRSLSPALTILGAFLFFQETPRLLQGAGMAIILAGYWGFAWLGKTEGIDFKANRWVWLLVGGTAIGATSGLYDKYLLQRAELDPTTLQLWFTVDNVALQTVLVFLLWWRNRAETPFALRWQIPLVGMLLVFADQLYFRALAEPDAFVSMISLVRRTSVIVSFTVGGLLFRERLLRKKALLLTVIFAGLILLFL